MIRKGNFIFTAAFIALTIFFFSILLDPLLKRALIIGGEKAAKAKVEIDSVNTKIFQGRLSIKGLAIADKDAPMTNLIEFQEAVFQLLPAPLLEKKFVIKEASITGLTWGMARKTSGALPPRRQKEEKPTVVQAKVDQAIGAGTDFGISRVEEAKKSGETKVDAVKPENLSSLKALDESKKKIDSVEETWKKRIPEQEAAYKTASERIKKDIEDLKAEKTTIGNIGERAKKVKEIQNEVKALQKDLNETKKAAKADMDAAQAMLDQAKAAKGKDLEALSSLLGIPSLDAESITKLLLGPVVQTKVKKLLGLFETVKQYMPPADKNKEAKAASDKERGISIPFPKEKSYPEFLLQTASLSGIAPLNVPLNFKGAIKDAAYPPSQWAKPLTVLADGKQGTQELKINGMADHRKENFQDRLDLKLTGLPVKNMNLGEGKEISINLAEGLSGITLGVTRKNEYWDGDIRWDITNAQLQPQLKVSGALGERLSQAITSIRNFSVQIGFKGQPENFDFKLKSDIGSRISEALKAALNAEIASRKKALQDKIDALYAQKAAPLQQQLQGKRSELLKPLDKLDGEAKKLLEQATGINTSPGGSPVNDGIDKLKKKLFK